MSKINWVLCPICSNKTRTKISPDAVLENCPLLYPKCKQETLIEAIKYSLLFQREACVLNDFQEGLYLLPQILSQVT